MQLASRRQTGLSVLADLRALVTGGYTIPTIVRTRGAAVHYTGQCYRALHVSAQPHDSRIDTPSSKDHQKFKDTLTGLQTAQDAFYQLTQEDADRIFKQVAKEANHYRLPLAKFAATETQMGCFEDKVLKNGLVCELILDRYRDTKTCGLISSDTKHGTKVYAHPAGPICAITPVTNPTSTAIAKCLFMAKTRNAGIFLPHPRATKSTAEAVRVCCEAGERAGAPKGWVQCVSPRSMEESQEIMKSDQVRLILSTGGPSVVRASYTSGKPALGVGSGNAPVLVDETADLEMACGFIVLGKTFDNGVICAAKQSVVAVTDVYDRLQSLFQERGVFFLTGEDRTKLAAFIRKDGKINPDIVGQTAKEVARRAGIITDLPDGTIVLGTEEDRDEIGDDHPLSHEKLSPVLTMFRADSFGDGVELCRKLALNGGIGHTAGLYTSQDNTTLSSEREKLFVERVPVGRVLVNVPTSLSAIGTAFNFGINPSFTLGVGTQAGSSVSGNVGPMVSVVVVLMSSTSIEFSYPARPIVNFVCFDQNLVNLITVAERQDHIEWFNVPGRIYFNRGCLEEGLRECAKAYASGGRDQKALIVTDKAMQHMGYVDRVSSALKGMDFEVEIFDDVHPDPDMECVRAGVQVCEHFQPDLMICLGGGSPLDAGKFIRVQYEHPELTLEDAAERFIELRKRTVEFPKLGSKIRRLVAIPTTSGTGSEVSPFTVITDDDGHKYPIASYKLTPDIAICDSTLCDALPKTSIANAGVDAVTHAIESYASVAHNDFTKMVAMEALELLFTHLVESYKVGSTSSRDAVHRGATLAGMAFSNSFLGICHSMAHQVGAAFHLPHGLTVGILMPHVIRYNASINPTRMGIYPSYSHPVASERYTEIAKRIGAHDVDELIERLQELMKGLDMPQSFAEAGVDEDHYMDQLDILAEAAFDDQCTLANPRFPLIEELKGLLIKAYHGN